MWPVWHSQDQFLSCFLSFVKRLKTKPVCFSQKMLWKSCFVKPFFLFLACLWNCLLQTELSKGWAQTWTALKPERNFLSVHPVMYFLSVTIIFFPYFPFLLIVAFPFVINVLPAGEILIRVLLHQTNLTSRKHAESKCLTGGKSLYESTHAVPHKVR